MVSVARRNQILRFIKEEEERIQRIKPQESTPADVPRGIKNALLTLKAELRGNYHMEGLERDVERRFRPAPPKPAPIEHLVNEARQKAQLAQAEEDLAEAVRLLETARKAREGK